MPKRALLASALFLVACSSSPAPRKSLFNFPAVDSPNPALAAGEVPRDDGEGADAYSYKVPKRDLLWLTDGVTNTGQNAVGVDAYGVPFNVQSQQQFQEIYPSRYFQTRSNEPMTDAGDGRLLGFSVAAERRTVAPDASLLAVRVTLSAPETAASRQSGKTFAILLDASASLLEPEKHEILQLAAKHLSAQIFPGDRVTITTIGADVEPLLRVDEPLSRAVVERLKRLEPRGEGQLAAGLDHVLQTMGAVAAEDGHPAHVILLSDGLSARGSMAPWRFEELAREARLRRGVQIHTVALGHQADVPFLADLARAGDGRFAYIETAAETAPVLDLALESMLDAFARDVRLRVRSSSGLSLRSVRGLSLPTPIEGVEEIVLGDVGRGDSRSFLLEIGIPSGETQVFTAELELSYEQPASRRRSRFFHTVAVERMSAGVAGETDRTVVAFAETLRGLDALRFALAERDPSVADSVSRTLASSLPGWAEIAAESGDRELLRHVRLFELHASRLRALRAAGKLTAVSVERDALAKEVLYRLDATR